jgi:hypothetical protein
VRCTAEQKTAAETASKTPYGNSAEHTPTWKTLGSQEQKKNKVSELRWTKRRIPPNPKKRLGPQKHPRKRARPADAGRDYKKRRGKLTTRKPAQ